VKALQKDLESNYTKFFKETFKDNDFESKWVQLAAIRHKVAHNNLFTNEDLNVARAICESLTEILNTAEDKIDEVVFSKDEQIAVEEMITDGGHPAKAIRRMKNNSVTEEGEPIERSIKTPRW
jgi:hypothetical protein